MIELKIEERAIQKEAGITSLDLLEEFGVKEEDALAAKLNGKAIDLYTPLRESGKLELIAVNTDEGLDVMRHSMAHLMAHAVLRIFKDVEFAIGPTIENGFYYDFDLDHKFTPEDFEKIEAEMSKIIQEDLPIRRQECRDRKSVV